MANPGAWAGFHAAGGGLVGAALFTQPAYGFYAGFPHSWYDFAIADTLFEILPSVSIRVLPGNKE